MKTSLVFASVPLTAGYVASYAGPGYPEGIEVLLVREVCDGLWQVRPRSKNGEGKTFSRSGFLAQESQIS